MKISFAKSYNFTDVERSRQVHAPIKQTSVKLHHSTEQLSVLALDEVPLNLVSSLISRLTLFSSVPFKSQW